MEVDGVIRWILKNPHRYPGAHLSPQPRTQPSHKPLEPHSQLLLIWKATIEYIHENLQRGQGVNMKGFGAFTMDIRTELAGTTGLDPSASDIHSQRLARKHLHRNRPVFVPDPSFEYVLPRYHRKNQLEKPSSQHSVYQRGFRMVYCNPVPVAHSCSLNSGVVRSAHAALFAAIKDLAKLGHSLHIKFNFCVLVIKNAALEVQFNSEFANSVKCKEFEGRMRRSDETCKSFWATTTQGKWQQSILSSLWTKPDQRAAQEMSGKTLALKVMSLDLTSCGRRPNTAV